MKGTKDGDGQSEKQKWSLLFNFRVNIKERR